MDEKADHDKLDGGDPRGFSKGSVQLFIPSQRDKYPKGVEQAIAKF